MESFVEMVKLGENLYTDSIKTAKMNGKTFVFHQEGVENLLKSGKLSIFAKNKKKAGFYAEKPEKSRKNR